MKVLALIESVNLFMEDASIKPQNTIAFPNKLIYEVLLMVKNSTIINIEERIEESTYGESRIYDVPCVPLEVVDKQNCPCDPRVGCVWLTTGPLPETLDDDIKSVFLPGRQSLSRIKKLDVSEVKNKKESRYQFLKEEDFIVVRKKQDGLHVFIEFYDGIEPDHIGVSAKFINPLDLLKYNCSDTDMDCNFLDQEMYIDPKYLKNVVEETVNILFRWSKMHRLPGDDIVDRKDFSQIPK